MIKLLKKLGLAIGISVGIFIFLTFLSTLSPLTSVIDMITNSVSYQTLGSGETISLYQKGNETENKEKLILGDSVADQLYVYRDNEEYCVMTGNMAMSLVWQYVYARDYMARNPELTDVYLCMTADTLEYSFETNLTYFYLVVPLGETNNMDVLEDGQQELLEDMYGSLFMKEPMVDYIGMSGLNKKMYINAVNKYYEIFPNKKIKVEKDDNPDFSIAETYILKMYELCKENGVTLHLIPNPKKDIPEYREYMAELEEKYKLSPLYEINPDYFEQIVWYPEECFKDELHFTDEFLEDGGKFEIIKDVQEMSGELEGLIAE